MSKALLVLSPGAEDIESITVVDILHRGGVEITIGAITTDYNLDIKCAHGTIIKADALLKDIDTNVFDVIVIPGGLQGAMNCRDSRLLGNILRQQRMAGGIIAAICASPGFVLTAHGILDADVPATGYPGTTNEIINYVDAPVVADPVHRVITAQGPAYSADFAFTILKALEGEEKTHKVATDMLY
ncbi:MAG: DJ-1 family glyoxalase III [Succinivibrionaceae bacterium]